MSAFIVSKHHIDVIVSGGSALLPALREIYGRPDEIGRVLWSANVNSVIKEAPNLYSNEEVELYLKAVKEYKFTEMGVIAHGPLAKAVACLAYQSDSGNGFGSGAYAILEAIRNAILESLPGYEDTPWGIEASDTIGDYSGEANENGTISSGRRM